MTDVCQDCGKDLSEDPERFIIHRKDGRCDKWCLACYDAAEKAREEKAVCPMCRRFGGTYVPPRSYKELA